MKSSVQIDSTKVFFRCLIQSIMIGIGCVALFTLVIVLITPLVHAEAESRDLQRIEQVQQGSPLFSTSHEYLYRNAPVLNTDVDMDITAMTARVRVTQMFHNQEQDWVEGIYVFPLPENAAVDHMRMKIGERVIEGVIKEKQEAKRIYQQAKSAGKKAALIEQERPNLFTNSVANIGPGEKVAITIEYQQSLSYVDETFSIRFPMTITPRFIPGVPLPAIEETLPASTGMGWALNTSAVPDASRITPPVLDDGEPPVNPVTMNIDLNAGLPLATIYSEYHAVDITRGKNGKAKIQLRAESAPADRDFVLQWKPSPSHAPRAALFSEQGDEFGGTQSDYSLMMIVPPVSQSIQALPREVVFIIDTSGSMGGIVSDRHVLP